ncbi:hypothetical protein FKP32DRAFT_1606503 [Trametes sanguinea]|nr:hypothetical protein FKP32DRAFT_1606503 [Trametes sanguinea]
MANPNRDLVPATGTVAASGAAQPLHISLQVQQEKFRTRDGKECLYLPAKLFDTDGFVWEKWDPETQKNVTMDSEKDVNPLPPQARDGGVTLLPFNPYAYGLEPIPGPDGLHAFFGPLLRPVGKSTSPTSHTNVAKAVEELQESKRLKRVKHCKHLLERLKLYADPNSQGVIPTSPNMRDIYEQVYGVRYNKACHRGMTTYKGPDPKTRGARSVIEQTTYGYPGAIQQYDAICGLADWLSARVNGSKPTVVDSEAAVQDAVKELLLQPLEMILHAGYGDFVLLNQYGAIPILNIEVKPFWASAYKDRVYERLFREGDLINPRTGEFVWTSRGNKGSRGPGNLLKQNWGELHYSQTSLGFSTNGSKLVVYIKTGPNELTLGSLVDFTDKDLLLILTGLVFASVDLQQREGLLRFLCDDSDPDEGDT